MCKREGPEEEAEGLRERKSLASSVDEVLVGLGSLHTS